MERSASDNQSNRPPWRYVEDENVLGYNPPPEVITEPDGNGIKKIISYYETNAQGRRLKITSTIRIPNNNLAKTLLSKRDIAQRKSWAKFGDHPGSRYTSVSTEDIYLEPPKPRAPFTVNGINLMVCRTCGKKGDHWTAQCPYKDLAQPPESFYEERGLRRWNDENSTVRVTNISEGTCETDLQHLFNAFGQVSCVNIVYDQKNGMSEGSGFVDFVRKSDAEKAITKLNGYGYNNHILRVEWAV